MDPCPLVKDKKQRLPVNSGVKGKLCVLDARSAQLRECNLAPANLISYPSEKENANSILIGQREFLSFPGMSA